MFCTCMFEMTLCGRGTIEKDREKIGKGGIKSKNKTSFNTCNKNFILYICEMYL